MAATASSSTKGKQSQPVVIPLSSSDDSGEEDSEEESEEDYEESEEESEEPGEGDGGEDGESPSEEDDGSGSSDGDGDGGHDCEELTDRVIDLLQRRKSLDVLKLEECKAYLRKHELRLSGTKATCIERILEHWRIKDGNGEKLYPKSSFLINCTGDVCRGDVILFRQRVYEKFDKVRRGGDIIGKRTIAGRVVKESYGEAKQQHTFTVEILWSKGIKTLPPLFPLLVKGRNLYRLKTFRQCWSNEVERSKVLAEKHRRGAAARHVREIAKANYANRGSKRQRCSSTSKAPANKRRKHALDSTKKKKKPKASGKAPPNGYTKTKKVANTRHFAPSATHPEPASRIEGEIHTQDLFPRRSRNPVDHYHTQMEFHPRSNLAIPQSNRGPLPNYSMGYSSSSGTPYHLSSRRNFISHLNGNPASHFYPGSSRLPYGNPTAEIHAGRTSYTYGSPNPHLDPRRSSQYYGTATTVFDPRSSGHSSRHPEMQYQQWWQP